MGGPEPHPSVQATLEDRIERLRAARLELVESVRLLTKVLEKIRAAHSLSGLGVRLVALEQDLEVEVGVVHDELVDQLRPLEKARRLEPARSYAIPIVGRSCREEVGARASG